MSEKLLLVEDDKSLGESLKTSLMAEGFEVKWCQSLIEARCLDVNDYSIILLDWMLPDGQGIDLLRELTSKPPTIMLTARADLIDKVLGLESGANDYITKPFELRELIARIRVQLRSADSKQSTTMQNTIQIENLSMDRSQRTVTYKDKNIPFAKMEFDLLYLLMSNPKQIFSREKLLDEVWGYENYPTTRTVDTHVLQIRNKIDSEIINTVRGIGYKFNSEHK